MPFESSETRIHSRKGLLVVATTSFVLLTAMSWMGCGDDDAAAVNDAGTSSDTALTDTSSPDAGADSASSLAIPIGGDGGAPYDTWKWIPVEGTQCANGAPTGIAINPHAGATSLTVYFEGGGACWASGMCETKDKFASNLDGFGSTEFATLASTALPNYALFSRTDTANPLANDNFIYVPYCTGDIHAGNNVATYTNDAGSYTIHHVGYANAQKDLAVLQATFPGLGRLIVTGSSAGGYGSAFNYEQFHLAFPTATPFLIDDSGPPLPNDVAAYSAQNASWHHFANLPAGCTKCRPTLDDGGIVTGNGISNLLTYYTSEPSFRGSLLETDHDNTISAFFNSKTGLGDEDNSGCVTSTGAIGPGPCDFTTALSTLYTDYIKVGNAAGPGQMHALVRHATFHTFLTGNAMGANPAYDAELKAFLGAQLGAAGAGAWQDITPF